MSCYFDSMDKINSNGVSVYLEMNSRSILNRLLNSKHKRPLVMNKSEDELLQFINDMLKIRSLYYQKSIIVIPALSINIDELASQVIEHGL